MKKIFLVCWLVGALLSSCSKLADDDHYKQSAVIVNDNLKIVDVSSSEYLSTRSDLTRMTAFLTDRGIFNDLRAKGQLHTLLVVANDNLPSNFPNNIGSDSIDFVARSHVSDIAMSPANLKDGDRIMMWHGKYVNVSMDEEALTAGAIADHIMMNNGTVKEVIKTQDGYIYVINEYIQTPTSLYDYIQGLGDDYSIFRDMVINSGSKEFDRTNSKAIGVNEEGNTIYDSVFVYKSTFFSDKGIDLNSESLTATMLLFSNKVIEKAFEVAHQKLESWRLTREDSVLRKWILKAAFFSKKYSKSEIQTADSNMIKSIYDCGWRTDVQKVDAENARELSNGISYEVKEFIFPKNVLIYRIKDVYHYWKDCTAEEKEKYFVTYNLTSPSTSLDVEAWTPLAGVWPEISNRILTYKFGEYTDGFKLAYTPLKLLSNEDGQSYVEPYLIPPGEYRLAMGFKQGLELTVYVEVLIDGQVVQKSNDIILGTATTYHYDRGATLSNRYPEGYDATVVQEVGGNKKASNYDTDGGPVIDKLVIPNDGNDTAKEIQIRVNCDNLNGKSSMIFYHWCLRPTDANY